MRVRLSTTAIFGDLSGYFFGSFRNKSGNTIWRYAAPCRLVTDCKMNDLEWPWVAISCQNPFSASTSWIRAFDFQKNNYVKSSKPMDPCCQRQKCRSMILVPGNIISRYSKAFLRFTVIKPEWGGLKSTNLQINEFAVFRFSGCYIFVSFGNNIDIVVHCDNSPFWIFTDTNKDDLECPIHRKACPHLHTVAEKCDCRRIRRLSPLSRRFYRAMD